MLLIYKKGGIQILIVNRLNKNLNTEVKYSFPNKVTTYQITNRLYRLSDTSENCMHDNEDIFKSDNNVNTQHLLSVSEPKLRYLQTPQAYPSNLYHFHLQDHYRLMLFFRMI